MCWSFGVFLGLATMISGEQCMILVRETSLKDSEFTLGAKVVEMTLVLQ
jgi:hypothetical protein